MKRLVAVPFAVLFLLASPAWAAERVTTPPDVTPISSGRLDLAFAVDKDVMLYAKAEFAGDRLHLVAADARQQQVIEIVAIGNRVYLRENTNTRWQATTVAVEDPGDVGVPVDTDLDEIAQYVTVYNLGRVDVRGIPTTQYQAQIDPVVLGAPNNVDYAFNLNGFIGEADAYLHKFQATIRNVMPSTGTSVLIELPVDLYDFNQSMVIGAPDPSLVDEVDRLASVERTDLPGSRLLPFWLRPLEEYSLKAKGYVQ